MRKSGFLMLKALKSAPHPNDIKKNPIIYNQDPIIYNQNFG